MLADQSQCGNTHRNRGTFLPRLAHLNFSADSYSRGILSQRKSELMCCTRNLPIWTRLCNAQRGVSCCVEDFKERRIDRVLESSLWIQAQVDGPDPQNLPPSGREGVMREQADPCSGGVKTPKGQGRKVNGEDQTLSHCS